MESTDGATGDGDEKTRENRLSGNQSDLLTHISKTIPELRDMRPFDEKTNHQRSGHEQEGKGKDRINLPHNLVYRQKARQYIIKENNDNPHHHAHR